MHSFKIKPGKLCPVGQDEECIGILGCLIG